MLFLLLLQITQQIIQLQQIQKSLIFLFFLLLQVQVEVEVSFDCETSRISKLPGQEADHECSEETDTLPQTNTQPGPFGLRELAVQQV